MTVRLKKPLFNYFPLDMSSPSIHPFETVVSEPAEALSELEANISQRLLSLEKILPRFQDDAVVLSNPRQLLDWSTNPSLDEIARAYAPPCLTSQFKNLYDELHPCLAAGTAHKASALLLGPRGSGKSITLQHVLRAIQDEKQQAKAPYRMVYLHGIILPGPDDVGVVVREMVLQLSATKESDEKQYSRVNKKLKLNDYLQTLDEILLQAAIERVPLLIVMDQLDTFVGKSTSKQLLLYHILDRLAKKESYIAFVGIACHQASVGLMEKRLQSRMTGTTKSFPFFAPATFANVVTMLESKLDGCSMDDALVNEIKRWLTKPVDDTSDKDHKCAYTLLERSSLQAKDMRWFSRVVTSALALYTEDLRRMMSRSRLDETCNKDDAVFKPKYLMEALQAMEAIFWTDQGEHDIFRDEKLKLMNGLSGPQVALIMSARRILARDTQKEDGFHHPLTFDRMVQEFRSYRGNSNRYNVRILTRGLADLIAMDVLRPAVDHSGKGAFQYEHDGIDVETLDPNILARMPLHMSFDLNREMRPALAKNLLDGSTALLEWGKKIN